MVSFKKGRFAILSGGLMLWPVFCAGPAHAAVTIPETFGQFCTATFGSTAVPECQGAAPSALATFQQQCTAVGGSFVPGSDPASPLFGNEARCIAKDANGNPNSGIGSLRDRLKAALFIGAVESEFDAEAAQQRADALLSMTRSLSDLLGDQGPQSTITGISRFAAEPEARDNSGQSPWAAFAYSDPKSPAFKAPLYVAPPRVSFGSWGQGFGFWERRSGSFDGTPFSSNATISGGQGGAHAIVRDVFSSRDALIIGVSGGGTSGSYRSNDGSNIQLNGPGVGLYAAYVRGGFSTQQVFNADFFRLNASTPFEVQPNASTRNFTYASDWNYRYLLGSGFWIEPTVGISYTQTQWSSIATATSASFQDGSTTRLQGGARIGNSFAWNGVRISPSLTGLVQDYVSVTGGVVAPQGLGAPPVLPTDQSKLFGRGLATVNVVFNRSVAGFLEGEIRGRDGVLGGGVRGGLSYSFQ